MNLLRQTRLLLLLASAACRRSDAAGDAPMTRVPHGAPSGPHWDWNGVIGTGQSLAVGVEGIPLRATEPSFDNLKLDLGLPLFPASSDASSRLSLVPLREPIRPLAVSYPAPFPGNIYGETPHTCMASQISSSVSEWTNGKGSYVTVHSVVGESGQALTTIAKGARTTKSTGHAYQASLFEARAITRLAKQARRSFGVSAIVLTHGEADAVNPDYEEGLYRLLQDYNDDLRRITAQERPARLLATQQSSTPGEPGTLAESAQAVLRASRDHAGEIVLVGPRYQYEYAPDATHLLPLGYDRLGEKCGQVYFERLVKGTDWRPLAPISAVRRGSVVSVEFHVPVPPLVWDEGFPKPDAAPGDAWTNGRGFELWGENGPTAIDAVTINGNKVDVVTREPLRGSLVVRYAMTATRTPRPGGSRRWGQLRDSDPFVGATTKTAQPNYAVTFELPVPPGSD
jgi:hypothetical protein